MHRFIAAMVDLGIYIVLIFGYNYKLNCIPGFKRLCIVLYSDGMLIEFRIQACTGWIQRKFFMAET